MKFHRDTVFRLSPLALALALPGPALAHGDDATDLDKVVVTATRTATTADAALAAVEVIDRAQIDASSARSLPELLRGRAGITLVNQGGLGKLSTLFLRGTESDHTLFLIDGVRVGSPASGLTMLQDLPLAQIERIEIVRGPRSSLYGADAIGGVIQIFTRRGEAEGVRGRGRIAAGDACQFDSRATRAEGHNDYDGDYVDNSDIVQQTVGGSVRWAAASDVQLKLTVGRNSDDSDNRLGSTFSNRFTTTRDSASLQADLTVAQGQLLSAGFDWLRDRATIVDPWSPFAAARGNRAVFAQYQGDFGAHDLQLSLRSDRNDQFGGHLTGGLAWGMDIADGWRVTASHGTAFKAPSFNELYYPGYSNPLLRPEASRSSEVSLQRSGDGWQVQANAYHTRIDDLVAWDASLGKPGNVEQARIRGLELAASVALGEWDLRGQLGWLDARNASTGFNHDKRLARRPTRSARIDLDRKFGNWGFGLSAIGEAARWDDVSNSLRVGGYGTLDGRVSWRFAPAWTLQANVVNLFDKRYETSAWYVQPGREYALSLRWQPQ